MDKKLIYFEMDGITRWHRYGKLLADRISCKIENSEQVLIWGEAGNGIREFLHIAAGIEVADEGKVEYEGRLAFVPEDFPEIKSMDVTEYMLLPLLIRGVNRMEAWRDAKPLLRESALWDKKSVKIQFLSGFEKCSLMVLMAFTLSPEILLVGNCMKLLSSDEEKIFWCETSAYIKKFGTALLCFSENSSVPYEFDRKYRLFNARLIGDV